ncbi:Na+/H+ antiporter subunit E [Devosia sp. 2618]|uniref:Na+/H+ antiporter subunit E n=1 Tax=Devosia sp. 2618 TaxID=3156454 RepID=UPI0033939112
MSLAAIVIALSVLWAAITGNFSGANLLLGLAIALVTAVILRDVFKSSRSLLRLRRIASLCLLFLYELMASAVRVAIVVWTPRLSAAIRPAIIAYPLTVTSDREITLLANLITLTPGTLSIDVSDDRSVLYIHTLNLTSREALIAEIAQGFEATVKEIYS